MNQSAIQLRFVIRRCQADSELTYGLVETAAGIVVMVPNPCRAFRKSGNQICEENTRRWLIDKAPARKFRAGDVNYQR